MNNNINIFVHLAVELFMELDSSPVSLLERLVPNRALQ